MLEEKRFGCTAGTAGHQGQEDILTQIVGKVTAQSALETDSGLGLGELLDALDPLQARQPLTSGIAGSQTSGHKHQRHWKQGGVIGGLTPSGITS